MEERLNTGSRTLTALQCGDHDSLQEPPKNEKAGRWSKTAQIIEVGNHDTYILKVDASIRLTSRFLRKITTFSSTIKDKANALPQPYQFQQPQPTQFDQPQRASAPSLPAGAGASPVLVL
jgi:hypothetical protein